MRPDASLDMSIRTCQRCPLWETRENAVPAEVGVGYLPGGLGLLLDNPRSEENAVGRPAMGKMGRLLDVLLAGAGLRREELVIVQRVRCAPPRGRTQDFPEAISNCDAWTAVEFNAYEPGVVVVMGTLPNQDVFGKKVKITLDRGTLRSPGKRHKWGERTYICTFHPLAAGLSGGADSEAGRLIVGDLITAKEVMAHGIAPF